MKHLLNFTSLLLDVSNDTVERVVPNRFCVLVSSFSCMFCIMKIENPNYRRIRRSKYRSKSNKTNNSCGKDSYSTRTKLETSGTRWFKQQTK